MATLAGLTVQYLVAFQNNAMDDPNLITSVATPPGTLGGNNVWTDITKYVTLDTPSPGRGRQHALQQFEAAGRQLTLYNADGRFTPANTSGPYTPYVTIRKPFQMRVTWSGTTYTRFTGQVDSWGTSWPDAAQQFSVLHVSDALRMFNLADITTGGYSAQVLADGATAFWKLNEPVGAATAVDSAGTNYGRYTGTYTLGVTGGILTSPDSAVNLMPSGSSPSGWVQMAGGTLPSTTTVYSIEAWVNGTNWSDITAGFGDIFTWWDSIGAQTILQVTSTGGLTFQSIGGGNLIVVTNSLTMSTSAWHHIVIVRNGITVVVYVDGVSQASTASPDANAFQGAAVAATIGWDPLGPFATFPGSVQAVAVYPTALTSGQVSNHFNLSTFPQEATGSRVGRVLTAIGWSSGARAIDTGKSTVQTQTSTLVSTSSLSHMQSVEATEGGALFMTVDGKVRFYARTSLQSAAFTTTNQAVFGDNTGAGDIPFLPAPTLALDDIDLYNEAVATRTGGNTQIAAAATSITANGRNTWNPPATLIGISDSEVLTECQYVVAKYATPVNRLGAITIDVVSTANSYPSTIPALLQLDLLDQVTVERTIVPGAGATFTQTCDIEHISDNINAAAGTWTITFGMELSDPSWWILGTSQLGTTTTLAW